MTENGGNASALSSIGVAHMEQDGTIIMELRAVGARAIGDGRLILKPDSAAYAATLDHLGGMKPGEHKPVRPFPENFAAGLKPPPQDFMPP